MPIELADPGDYDKINVGDKLRIEGLLEAIRNKDEVKVVVRPSSTQVEETGRYEFVGKLDLSERARQILLAGGLLRYTLEKRPAEADKNDKGGKRIRKRDGKTG